VPQPEVDDADADANPDADVTIRLVGGGGIAGAAGIEAPPDSAFVLDGDALTDGEGDTDVESVSSQVDADAAKTESGKEEAKKGHKKTRSGLAGLKKLGNIGGLRKKDPSASGKDSGAETVAAPAAA
jgi:hypothetical protein